MKKTKFVTLMTTVVLATASGAVLADEQSSANTGAPQSALNGLADAPGTGAEAPSSDAPAGGAETAPETPATPGNPTGGEIGAPAEPAPSESSDASGDSAQSSTPAQSSSSSEEKGGDAASTPESDAADSQKPEESKSSDAAAAENPKVDVVPSPEKPVETVTGYSIVGTNNGQVIIAQADGTTATVSPETVGGKLNADKTITVTDSKGKKKTLPNTGDAATGLLSMLGMVFVALAGMFVVRGKHKA